AVGEQQVEHHRGLDLRLAVLAPQLDPCRRIPAHVLLMLLGPAHRPEQRADDLIALPGGEDEALAGVGALGVDEDLFDEPLDVVRAWGAEVVAALGAGAVVVGPPADRQLLRRGTAPGTFRRHPHRPPRTAACGPRGSARIGSPS